MTGLDAINFKDGILASTLTNRDHFLVGRVVIEFAQGFQRWKLNDTDVLVAEFAFQQFDILAPAR